MIPRGLKLGLLGMVALTVVSAPALAAIQVQAAATNWRTGRTWARGPYTHARPCAHTLSAVRAGALPDSVGTGSYARQHCLASERQATSGSITCR